jgi:formate dehydrogenase iron-sulfur subunit
VTQLFISADSMSLALGSRRIHAIVAGEASRRDLALDIVMTGSRGLFWLEPLIEVETSEGRIAYGPVKPSDVISLFDSSFLTGAAHPLRLGRLEDQPYLSRQMRLTFERCGIVDPSSIDGYLACGGYVGLRRSLPLEPQAIVDEVKLSGLRGRGGAGFPTGIKWGTVLLAEADQKYIVCNADEGDSGTFADRMLMEGDPFSLIEGMTIAGLAVGATKGFIYIRSEYPHAYRAMSKAIEIATEAGYLGSSIMGSGRAFTLETRLGAGAYICGEETSLLESLEGKRGMVRAKPPLPALKGLFGKPTVVNNVLSLATVPWIMTHGGQAYADFGLGRSRHAADPACGQHQARGAHRTRFRGDPARDHRGFRGRYRNGTAPEGGSGRRASGCLLSGSHAGHPLGLRSARSQQRASRPWRDRGVRRYRRPLAAGSLRLRILRG